MRVFTQLSRPLLLFALLGSCCVFGYSQKTLKGIHIVNAETKVPVEDAFVQSEDGAFNASADENGFVSFKNLPATISQVSISRIGFASKTIDIPTLTVSDNSAIVYLQAKVSSLQE